MQLLSPLHLNKHVSTLHKQRRQQSDDIAKEMEKRQGKSATYTQLLQGRDEAEQQDMESFLTEFYGGGIFDKAREMRTLVRHHPATVGTHYALLVPNVVSFDQFWSRYFYRCSSTTILQDLRRADKAEAEEENDPATTTPTTSAQLPLSTMDDDEEDHFLHRGSVGDVDVDGVDPVVVDNEGDDVAVVTATTDASGGGGETAERGGGRLRASGAFARKLLERGMERGMGVMRTYSGSAASSSLDTDDNDINDASNNNKLYQAAMMMDDMEENPAVLVVETNLDGGDVVDVGVDDEAEETAPTTEEDSNTDPVDALLMQQLQQQLQEDQEQEQAIMDQAAARAQVFRCEDDTDIIETIVEFEEMEDDSCVSEEDSNMMGSGAAVEGAPEVQTTLELSTITTEDNHDDNDDHDAADDEAPVESELEETDNEPAAVVPVVETFEEEMLTDDAAAAAAFESRTEILVE